MFLGLWVGFVRVCGCWVGGLGVWGFGLWDFRGLGQGLLSFFVLAGVWWERWIETCGDIFFSWGSFSIYSFLVGVGGIPLGEVS